jgi:hypothetical protein
MTTASVSKMRKSGLSERCPAESSSRSVAS